MNEFEKTIDEVLNKALSAYFEGAIDSQTVYSEARTALIAAHNDEVARIIGEDDTSIGIYQTEYGQEVSEGRNELRAEQRQRAGLN